MTVSHILYKNDIPAGLKLGDVLAVDSEFMGLNPWRDRLCLLQIYDGEENGTVHVIQFEKGKYAAPNLKKLLADAGKKKIFYFARGDMRWIAHYLGVMLQNVYCVKIASRIARTYVSNHELEDISRHVLGIKMSKEQQCTNWGAETLTEEQITYACNDVLHLHEMMRRLDGLLLRENRKEIADGLMDCIPAIVKADLAGWLGEDLFAYFTQKLV